MAAASAEAVAPSFSDPLNTQLETVNTTTIDAAFGGDKIAFLKIDAEGMDGRVLRGAARLLSLGRISTVYWESNPVQNAVNDSLRGNVAFLSNMGCESFLFGRDRLLPLPAECPEGSALFSSDGLQRFGTRKTVPENVVSFCGGGERTTHMHMHLRSVKRLVSECFPAGLIHR